MKRKVPTHLKEHGVPEEISPEATTANDISRQICAPPSDDEQYITIIKQLATEEVPRGNPRSFCTESYYLQETQAKTQY